MNVSMPSFAVSPRASAQRSLSVGLPRREMLRALSIGTLGLLCSTALAVQEQMPHFKGNDVFNRLVKKAADENWKTLTIGQLIGKIAMELNGTPYVGFTLELSKDQEFCVVNLDGLDCVTFFEDSLCMARMLKKGKSTPEDLLAEVQFTRYRGGKLGDFTSRLHYTTDWFVDNEKKGVVKILAPELPGAQPFTQKVGIMSKRPQNYRQLAAHPEMVAKIRVIEDTINGRSLKFVPLAKLKAAEPLLQTGDIVGVATTEDGIKIPQPGF